jgi:hypothetical protein
MQFKIAQREESSRQEMGANFILYFYLFIKQTLRACEQRELSTSTGNILNRASRSIQLDLQFVGVRRTGGSVGTRLGVLGSSAKWFLIDRRAGGLPQKPKS